LIPGWLKPWALAAARLGPHNGAPDVLAPVNSWFTEAFDTSDLTQAKALLDELAGPPDSLEELAKIRSHEQHKENQDRRRASYRRWGLLSASYGG
jgi:hypothetical protein